jgi:hypothetical protein
VRKISTPPGFDYGDDDDDDNNNNALLQASLSRKVIKREQCSKNDKNVLLLKHRYKAKRTIRSHIQATAATYSCLTDSLWYDVHVN